MKYSNVYPIIAAIVIMVIIVGLNGAVVYDLFYF